MSEELRLLLNLISNVCGAGFVTFMGFDQLGSFYEDNNRRHIVAAVAWWVLCPVFVLRALGVPEPPLIAQQTILDGAAIGWATTLILALVWAVWLSQERRRARHARRNLGDL